MFDHLSLTTICALRSAFTLIHHLIALYSWLWGVTVSLLPSRVLPLPNRGRRSCACVCDSEVEVLVMVAWPWEEPALGDVRTWSGCVWWGIRQTAGASGSSLRTMTRKAGCPGRPLGACSWAELEAPGWAGWKCRWKPRRCCGLSLAGARRTLGGGTGRCSRCSRTGGGGRAPGGGGTSLPRRSASWTDRLTSPRPPESSEWEEMRGR